MGVLFRAGGAFVGAPVIGCGEVAFQECDGEAQSSGEGAPASAEAAAYEGGGGEAEGEEVEDVGEEEGGEGVVEVGYGFVGGAEGAVG